MPKFPFTPKHLYEVRTHPNGKQALHIKEKGYLAESAVAILKGGTISIAQEVQPFPQATIHLIQSDIQPIVDFLRSQGVAIK